MPSAECLWVPNPDVCAQQVDADTLCLPKIPSAQVGQLFGFGGGRMSWLLREGPLGAA
jgi:hypothetical protein